jgi:hypothetical protein
MSVLGDWRGGFSGMCGGWWCDGAWVLSAFVSLGWRVVGWGFAVSIVLDVHD